MRPLAKRLSDVPIPEDDYFDAIEVLFERLRGVDEILGDPKITTVRLVTNPERIVLRESQRAFLYFSLYKMNIDGIIMNRTLPKDVRDDYFQAWRKSQRHHIRKAEEYFSPIPIFCVNLFKNEIVGYTQLKALAGQIYSDKDPLTHFYEGEPYRLMKTGGRLVKHARYYWLLLAEGRLNRKLFRDMLLRIWVLPIPGG